MKWATLIVATLSHHRPTGDAMDSATIALAIGVLAGATLHRLGPCLPSLPRAPPSRDDGEPQARSFSTRLAVAMLPQIPKKPHVSFLGIHKIQKGEITMKKERIRKLLFVGVCVACALGTSMSGKALATDPVGQTNLLVVGPIALGEIDVYTFTPVYFNEIETLGLSDVYIVRFTIDPGGHTGWHSHPGAVVVLVNSGDATMYEADDPTRTPVVHQAGTGFTEQRADVHIVKNEGTTELEILGFFLVPKGEPRRIDEPDPWGP
jgi:quercetin dioxygenase-like cupin family protein